MNDHQLIEAGLLREVEQFLFREARLLDDLQLDEWLTLFEESGIYWVPIQDGDPDRNRHVSLVYDDALAREERVYHLLHVQFPAQSPPSRTVHLISNVEVLRQDDDRLSVRSSQVTFELRSGDFRQVGLGQQRCLVGRVEHELGRNVDGHLRILQKKVVLLDRDMPHGNLTFLL